MAYKTIGRRYDQGTVFAVDIDVAIKKFESEDTYQGTRITYRDKNTDKLEEAKWATSWLGYSYQKDIKAKIATLKQGDEVTFYKEKSAPEENIAGKSAEELKKVGNWGVSKIYDGFVVPEEIVANQPNRKPAGGKYEGYDAKGTEVGHCINAALFLLTAAKGDDSVVVVETCKQLHDLTIKLKEQYQLATGFSTKRCGFAVGHAILNASRRCKTVAEVEVWANKLLTDVTAPVDAYVRGGDTAKTTKPKAKAAKKEAKKEAKVEEKAPALSTEVDDSDPF